MNALVAKAAVRPADGWAMPDGTPWPGNDRADHVGMIQVSASTRAAGRGAKLKTSLFEFALAFKRLKSLKHILVLSTVSD